MAIDTRDKRFSMMGLGSPVPMVLPNPDGAFGTQDRAFLVWLYAGLALDSPSAFVPSALRTLTVAAESRTYTPAAESRSYTVAAESRTYTVPEVA